MAILIVIAIVIVVVIVIRFIIVAVADECGLSGLTSVPKELGGLINLQQLGLDQNGARE